jgi:hypothetical protein
MLSLHSYKSVGAELKDSLKTEHILYTQDHLCTHAQSQTW